VTDADRLTPSPTDRHRPDERRREERNVNGKKRKGETSGGGEEDPKASEDWLAQKQARVPEDPTNFRSGGAYIPPAKLKRMQEQIGDKNRYFWVLNFLTTL
jgi:pre-mRNA-splicing factor CWC22